MQHELSVKIINTWLRGVSQYVTGKRGTEQRGGVNRYKENDATYVAADLGFFSLY